MFISLVDGNEAPFSSDLRQLAQRITGRYHLEPLEPEELRAYIRHRLEVAGGRGEIFSTAAIRELHRSSWGAALAAAGSSASSALPSADVDFAYQAGYGQVSIRVPLLKEPWEATAAAPLGGGDASCASGSESQP